MKRQSHEPFHFQFTIFSRKLSPGSDDDNHFPSRPPFCNLIRPVSQRGKKNLSPPPIQNLRKRVLGQPFPSLLSSSYLQFFPRCHPPSLGWLHKGKRGKGLQKPMQQECLSSVGRRRLLQWRGVRKAECHCRHFFFENWLSQDIFFFFFVAIHKGISVLLRPFEN